MNIKRGFWRLWIIASGLWMSYGAAALVEKLIYDNVRESFVEIFVGAVAPPLFLLLMAMFVTWIIKGFSAE